jgi:CRISPR system Cascade subunit CasD
MRCLILRLEGPLMSFGDTAIDEIRPTRRLPGRSLLTGLIANALGWEHRDVDALTRLQERLRFAVRLDRPGEALVDFQTAELSQDDPIWTTRGVPAERAGGANSYSGPALRYRHYRADSRVTVALTLDPPEEAPDLGTVSAALQRPERPLFIGRKGCPPARPILDGEVDASSLVAALEAVGDEGAIETEDHDGEPGGTSFSVADRRDWRMGFHAGLSRRRRVRAHEGGGAA